MILTNDVVEFIEKTKNIKLFDFQKRIIKNIIEGNTVRVPRGCGITFLIDAYSEYLRDFYNNRNFLSCEDCVSGYDLINEGFLDKEIINKAANCSFNEKDKKRFESEFIVYIDDFITKE